MQLTEKEIEQFAELKKNRPSLKCITCRKEFISSFLYQLYCSDFCEELRRISDIRSVIRYCKHCGQTFKKITAESHVTVCMSCKHEAYLRTNKKCPIEMWLKEKKIRKGLSLSELIRRQEWKRVYGKGAWDHYLKGRRWDKI